MTTTFKKHVLAASVISVLGSVSSAALAQEQASADDFEKIGGRVSLRDLKKNATLKGAHVKDKKGSRYVTVLGFTFTTHSYTTLLKI